jgi:integrase/recombinase XerD
MATYLSVARPICAARTVFVRVRAPHRALVSISAIQNVVRKSLRRAGINKAVGGTHLFRHSLATRMVRAHVPMQEIANVLGHRFLSTTEIYAKVDLPSLRSLAVKWPKGGEQ